MRQPMRSVLMFLLAAALGVSSAFLVACGDRNDLIPRSDADAINQDLDRASLLYRRQECRAAEAAVVDAQSRASRLPDAVDPRLRTTLAANLQHVLQRVQAQCAQRQTTQSTQSTQTTATTPTTSTQPTTTATEPTTTTSPPTTTEDHGGDQNNGGGNGGGRGGDGNSGGSEAP